MISFITIILFFLYTWGLGFTVTYFLKKPENSLERFFMNVGIGLGVFAILSIFLNFLHIPLDWKIFLILSLALPFYKFLKKPKLPQLNLKIAKSTLFMLAVLIIFFFSLYMYLSGAFSYPYLENEDPWGHAVGAKYVALEKTAYDPVLEGNEVDPVLSYIDPYPPAYDILIGVLHQTSPDLNWTLKFFNTLIISLSFIFFYLFVQLFTKNRNKALFATFLLLAIPSYFSHFIWAHTLVVTLFFPTMYAFEKIKEDKKWMYPAALLVAAIWVSQNLSQPIKLSTMLIIYLVVFSIAHKKFFTRGFAALFGGIAISTVWWGAMIKKYGLQGFLAYFSGGNITNSSNVINKVILSESQGILSFFSKILALVKKVTSAGGSGSRIYNFEDFFIAKSQNMINSPIGLGVVVTLLVVIGVIYIFWKHKSTIVKEKNTWLCVTIFWLIFTFWGVMGIGFPISVARGTFRVWMLLAVPVSLIAIEGYYFLKKLLPNKMLKLSLLVLIIMGVIFTSGVQKYELNSIPWITAGAFQGNIQEAHAYGSWFETIPLNTKVFLYAPRDKITIGFGMNSCAWCQNVVEFREEILYKDAMELHNFLRENNYEYLILNGRMDVRYFNSRFGENDVKELLPQRYNEITSALNQFTPVHQVENGFVVFKVN